ncbi:uncharacterized protein B0I36DRAFT_354197 [Microdochium trichocladiopsis]|uniref:Uncharacterized protein n=1 Tax=Microdochium trichocladiopsis TaxID=1682393 RepID=A0A9P8XY49_9PEZI|nr:uncharacterized protein B0I36DRAFT_354197 [Microdochium trichocladiopsis]KAH7021557.1 hypothetical protein B0I36DRAFT_354197 [Microdochium trichocladiopsis]
MASNQAGNSKKARKKFLVFVDCPDPDNWFMVLSIIRRNPRRRVCVILSPRPVDLTVKNYGTHFPEVYDAVSEYTRRPNGKVDNDEVIRRMMTPFTEKPKWVTEIKQNIAEEWFSKPDRHFEASGSYFKSIASTYIKVIAHYWTTLLDGLNIPRDRYQFYTDEDSMQKISPGLRHQGHSPDYIWVFREEEEKVEDLKERLDAALKSNDGEVRERLILQVWNDYIQVKDAKRRASNLADIVLPFDQLIEEEKALREEKRTAAEKSELKKALPLFYGLLHKKDTGPRVAIGGPFTEALKWVENDLPMESATAMACYISGNLNILTNQFNVAVDMYPAWTFLKLVEEKQIHTVLVPTEVIKEKEWRNNKLAKVFENYPRLYELVRGFTRSGKLQDATMFDWNTALIDSCPELLKTKRVRPVLKILREVGTEKDPEEVDFHGSLEASPKPPAIMLRVEVVRSKGQHYLTMCWTEKGFNGRILKKYHDKIPKMMIEDLTVCTHGSNGGFPGLVLKCLVMSDD